MASLCGTKLCDQCPQHKNCGGCPGCDRIFLNKHNCSRCLFSCVDKIGLLPTIHFDFDDLNWPKPTREHVRLPPLPDVIPTVGSITKVPVEWEAWIPKIYKIQRQPRSMSLAKNTAIHGYSPDSYLADLWAKRQDYWEYYSQFDLVFTPNFSIYDNAPRMEQLINMYRTALCYAEMVDYGLPVILDVTWGQWPDVERQAQYITDVHPPAIAMSLQGIGAVKMSKDWIGVAMGYAAILNRIPKDIKVIFVGVASKSRADTVRELVNDPERDIHWMNTLAYMRSRYGRFINLKKADKSLTRDQVFQINVSERSAF